MHIPLEIIGLSKDYEGKDAVKNISFKLNQMKLLEFLVQMDVEKLLL